MESVKVLLQLGADATITNPYGLTPFHVAATSGNLEIVKEMMKDWKDQLLEKVNKKGQTPLFVATKKGRTDVVTWLVEHDADVKVKDNSGTSLLSISANKGHVDVVRYLIGLSDKTASEVPSFTNILFII